MKRLVPLWTTLLLAGCGFPYTPHALPSLTAPDPGAAPPAPIYTPPRQTEFAAPTRRLSGGARPTATATSDGTGALR